MIARPGPLILALGWVLLPGPAALPAAAATGEAPRVVLDAGVLYVWDHASPDLAPFPGGLLPGDAPPIGLADPGDDRGVLILRAAEDTGERGHNKNKEEGEALLLAWSPAEGPSHGFVLAWTTRFDGLPRAATATAGRAWVLARRASSTRPGSGRLYVHEIDRTSGRVEDSTILPEPAAALAADPLGRRLYAALDNRILSLTTRPLVTSWHHRSPGKNGALAISPSGAVLAVARGREVALFDEAVISARPSADRRARADDATTVTPLPLAAETLAFSEDGRLLAAFGAGGMVFIETATGAVIWPETAAPMAGAAGLQPLSFPGEGRDIIIAAFPAAAVAALPSPQVAGGAPDVAPDVAGPAGPPPAPLADIAPPAVPPPADTAASAANAVDRVTAAPAQETQEPVGAGAVDEPAQPESSTAGPTGALPAPAGADSGQSEGVPPATQAREVAGPPVLSGTIAGNRALARAVVLYGPDNIIREFTRVTPDPAGGWRLALPPPGVYRVVVIGDGSTPIPVAPAFLTVTVVEGETHAGIDFTVGAASR